VPWLLGYTAIVTVLASMAALHGRFLQDTGVSSLKYPSESPTPAHCSVCSRSEARLHGCTAHQYGKYRASEDVTHRGAGMQCLCRTRSAYNSREKVVNRLLTWTAAVNCSLMTTPSIVRVVTRAIPSHGSGTSAVLPRFPLPRNLISLVLAQFNCKLFF